MTLKVMMADDDASMRRLVQTVCEEAGYACCVAEGGEGALALFQREGPDVVVLDVMMPKVDGFEVCRRIRAVDENVPVLFLSARDGIIDKRIGFSFGGDDYLVKPFNEEELLMRIEALVRRSRRVQRTSTGTAEAKSRALLPGPVLVRFGAPRGAQGRGARDAHAQGVPAAVPPGEPSGCRHEQGRAH